MSKQAETQKHKKKKEKKKKDHHEQTRMVHISQLGSTTVVNANKLKDAELGQLLETLAIEAKTRSQQRRKELDNNEKEQVKFLKKCRSLVQTVRTGPAEVDTNKPLEKSY